MSINKVFISGNLTRNPELRATTSGTTVMTFGLAVEDRRRDQRGEWSTYTNFVDCTMFGERAEKLAQYLSKGRKVSVEGRLRYSSWDGPDGGKRSKLEVIVEEIEFMSSGQNQQTQYQPQYQPQFQQPVNVVSIADEDIPF